MDSKVSKGVRMLKAQGHLVEPRIQFEKKWWQVDGRMLVSPEEIENLADGVYSLSELEELYVKRRAEETSREVNGQ